MADIINPDKTVMTHNADVYWHYAGDPVQRAQLLGTFTIGTAQKVLIPVPTDSDIVLRAVPRGGRGQTFMGSPADATPVTIHVPGLGTGGGTSNFYQQLKVNHGYSYGTVPTPRPVLNLLQSFQIKDDSVFGESDLTTFGVPTGMLNLKTDFNASGQIAVTTATWSGTGSDIVLATTLELQPGQGIYVAGAGVSGSPLITTCLAVSADGKTITLNAGPFTAGPYSIVQADDTAAVQAWLKNPSTGLPNGDLAMPPGYYRLSSSITLPTTSEGFSTIIHGSGWDQSQFVFQHGGDGFIPTAPDLKIDSMVFLDLTVATGTVGNTSGTIDANSKGIGIRMTAPSYTGIYNNFVLQRCRVIGWGRWGLWSDNLEVSWISQCIFRENKSGHIAFVGPDTISPNKQPNANTITDSTFDQAISAGPSDAKRTFSGSMTAGNRTLSGSGFTANDRGKFVIVHGAATGSPTGGDLFTFIDTFTSSSQVTLAHQAQNTVTNTVELFPVNVASILLNRANDTVLDGSTIQGNFADAGSGATNVNSDVNAIKCYNSANCRFIGIHEEDNAGPGGAAIRMENCVAMTIENWGGTSAGPPDFLNAHRSDFAMINCHCVSVKNSFFNDRPQFEIDPTSSEIQIDDSFIVGDINLWQQDNSWDRLRIGSGVRVYQAADPRTNRVAGNEYSYDGFFGRNLITNGRLLDGSTAAPEGWTIANPTWWSITRNSQTQGGTFLNVDATTQSPSTFATKIFSQLVPIPDTTGPGLFTLGFNWNLDSQNGVETTGYYVEVRLHPSSGIDEVLQWSTRRFAVVQDTWQVGHIRCFLGSGTGRTIEVQINVTPGANNVVMHFANFRLAAGKHIYGAWEEGIHDFGGRMHAPLGFAPIATSGTGSTAPPPVGATYMTMVQDAGVLKLGYNGVWTTVGTTGTVTGVAAGTPQHFTKYNSSGTNIEDTPVIFEFGQVHFKLVGAWLDRTLPIVSVYGSSQTAELAMVDSDDVVYFGPKLNSVPAATGANVTIRAGRGVSTTADKSTLQIDGANGRFTINANRSVNTTDTLRVTYASSGDDGVVVQQPPGTTGTLYLGSPFAFRDLTGSATFFSVDHNGGINFINSRQYTWPSTTPVNTGGIYNVLGYVGQSTANNPVTLVWTPMTGGSGGHVIQDEGGPLPAQGALNFTGAGVTASNNTTFPRTDVTIWTATTTQEGTVSTGAQTFAGRKQFNNGVSIIDSTGGTDVALVVQDSGVSGGTHIQEWWTSGVTPLASIDTQPVLRLGIPGGADGFLELCSAGAGSQTVKIACGVGATQAQILRMPKTQPASGNVLQVLSGGPDAQLQWGAGSGPGGGISQIQEEGTNLAVRSTLNFIGSGFTAADDSANNRTNVTLFAASVTQDGIVNNLAQTFTGRKTFNVGATMQSIASIEPVLTCKLIAGGGTSARVQEWQNSSTTVLAYLDATPKFSMACDVLPDVDYPTTARHLGNSAFRWAEVGTGQITWNSSNVRDIIGSGSPTGISAPAGCVYRNTLGTAGQTLWVRESAAWVAVGAGGGGGAGTGTNNTLPRWTTTSGILADSGIVDNVASGFGSAGNGIVFNRDFVYGRADGTINFGDTTTRIGGVYIKNALWMWTGANVGNSPSSPTTMGFLSGGASTYSRILVSGNENYIQGSPQGGRLTIGGYHAIELRGSRRNPSAGSVSTTAGDGYGVLVWQEGAVNTIVPLVVGSQLALIGDLTNWQNNGVEQAALNAAGTLRMGGLQGRIVRLNPGAGVTVDMATQFGLMDCRTIVCDLASGSFKIRLPFLSTCNGRSWHIVLRPKSVISSAFFVSLMVQSGDDINEVAMTTTSEWQLNINSNLQRYVVLTADYNAGSSPQWRLAGFNSP